MGFYSGRKGKNQIPQSKTIKGSPVFESGKKGTDLEGLSGTESVLVMQSYYLKVGRLVGRREPKKAEEGKFEERKGNARFGRGRKCKGNI